VLDRPRERWYVIREAAGHIRVLGVLIKDGKVGMPDFHWWNPEFYCRDFRPTIENGRLTAASRFACHDVDPDNSWSLTHWVWDAEGRYAGPGEAQCFDDMPNASIEEHEGFVLVKRLGLAQ